MSVARQVSLPDLVTEKRRNTAMSLSEGFPGFERKPALAATALGFKPFTGGSEDSSAKLALAKILPVYYRTRQFVLSTEKSGLRIPRKLQQDLKNQEQAVASHLRSLHPLFFQRFDELQLDRLLRAMPFLRLSQGRYIFGGENDQAWNETCGEAVFLLLSGRVSLYPEPAGKGHPTEIREGAIFGEQKFRLGDEGMRDTVATSAKAEEPSMVGMLSSQVLETAFADRAFGNRRIAQVVENIPALTRITKPEKKHKSVEQRQRETLEERKAKEAGKPPPKKDDEQKTSDACLSALGDLSKISTGVHVVSGQEVRSSDPLDENLLVVSKGGLEVIADVTLTERLESLPPKRVRINVHIEKCEKLAGETFFDKLDPYVIVKMGDFKRFQTPVMNNAGKNPRFEYDGVLTYNNEEEMEFTVMDHDRFSADDLCGNGVLKVADLPDGWHGKVELHRPKRGIYKSDSTHEEEAGRVVVTIKWDFQPITAGSIKPKQKMFPEQVLFELGPQDCWGHETLVLGAREFRRSLEHAAHGLRYFITLSDFKVIGSAPKGVQEVCTVWKVAQRRFLEFISKCSREKQFKQACRVSSLEKQNILKEHIHRLVKKWETEELMNKMSRFMLKGDEDENKEEVMDPSRFRVAYRDCKARITVRNALNLTGGGLFDKLDPYAVVRFRGSKTPPFKTSVLEDAGSDPFWACEGCRHKGGLLYNGETVLEVSVWDYDKYSNDDLIATGTIQVEQFCRGFEGSVPLNLPEGKKRKASMKQMMIVMGVQWDPPKAAATLDQTKASTTMRSAVQGMAIANQTF
jgi:hypothetical protein